MALFKSQENNTIVNAVKMADKDTRNEFYQGKVVGENDYTSTMLTRIRNDINKNSSSLNAKYLAQLLPPAAERKWGVDACFIFINNQGTKTIKIGVFEAKVKKPQWDYSQTNKKNKAPESHFSSQLERQANLLSKYSDIAIWEQFYTQDSPGSLPGANMSTWGSSCVEHVIAIQHNNSPLHTNNTVWSEKDITTICSNQVSSKGTLQTVEMHEFVEELLQCSFGNPIPNNSIKDICDQLPMMDTLIISNNIRIEDSEMAVKSIYSEYLKELLTD